MKPDKKPSAWDVEQQALNRTFYDADKKIIEDLERNFTKQSPIRKTTDGNQVDTNMTLVACGHHEVISFIKQRIAKGAKAR